MGITDFPVANLSPAGKSHVLNPITMSKSAISVRAVLAVASLWGVVNAASAQTAGPIIAKARAYLGNDAALDAIKSVHFVGSMETQEPASEGPKAAKSMIEIIFQEPYQQRITVTTASTIRVTALDDYDGWQRVQETAKEGRWRLVLLQPDVIKKLRANTWENLNFYKGIERHGGSVQVLGLATVAGSATVKVAFIHEPGITFYRYFDAATGRLVLTETDRGDRIREEGEILVDGLRFPQKHISTGKARDANGQTVDSQTVITFDRITLNETFPESDFEVPMMTPQREEPAPAVPPVVPPASAPTAPAAATKP
jgi:hypothetical protein